MTVGVIVIVVIVVVFNLFTKIKVDTLENI